MQRGTTDSTRACIGTIRRYDSCFGKTVNGTPHSQLHGAGPDTLDAGTQALCTSAAFGRCGVQVAGSVSSSTPSQCEAWLGCQF